MTKDWGDDERRLTDSVSVLVGPANGAYPSGNTLLVRGASESLLIDPSVTVVERGAPTRVDAVVNSHSHEDHVAGNGTFPDARVHVHVDDLPGVQSLQGLMDVYGMPIDHPFATTVVEEFSFTPRPDAHGFTDGHVFDLGGGTTVEAVHLPGHTRGHSGFRIGTDVFFLSDIDLTGFGPYYGDVWSDLEDFEASLAKVRDEDARWYVTFHHKGVIEGREEFLRLLDAFASRHPPAPRGHAGVPRRAAHDRGHDAAPLRLPAPRRALLRRHRRAPHGRAARPAHARPWRGGRGRTRRVPGHPMTVFADLGLEPRLLDAVTALGYEEPTPIQRDAIPEVLAGRDVLGQAATGTGKTAAFALPALQLIDEPAGDPIALVLVPTRELAVQVSEACYRYGRGIGAKVVPVYGGQPIFRQLGALRDGVHIVVATPGRAIDHINRGTLALANVKLVVLDEADEMLDMGFAEDIEAILEATPDTRQTVLFSATMPPRIERIARRFIRDPVRIEIGRAAADSEAPRLITERAFVVTRAHKAAALGRILDVEEPAAAIVFCRTRTEVDELTETLNGRGYRAEALHGGMNQEGRDRVMGRLRNGTAELLIATDVAARGLDVDILTHVVNYDVPSAPDAYVHRIGRVGRAGREGVAITLAEPRELRLLSNIERATKRQIPVEQVPSVAELRSRQLDATAVAVREATGADDLERFAPILDGLTSDSELRTVALAALKVTHEARTQENEEVEIPAFVPRGPAR